MDGSVSSKRLPVAGGGGAALETVTVTGAETGLRLPGASRAIAVILCEPSLAVAVFHEIEYGAVVASALPLTPSSSRTCTPTTPTLSEAVAVTVAVPFTVAPLLGAVILPVGGVVSGGGGGGALFTVTVTAETGLTLPAASRATAVRVCEPLLAEVVSQDTEYGAVVSSAPRLEPSSLNCTPTTPTLSEALAVTLVVPKTVAPEAGAVIFTVGGVVSGGGGGGALFTVTVTGAGGN